MSEISSLTEVSTHQVQTTDKTVWYTLQHKTHECKACWYASEDTKHSHEFLSRYITKDVYYGDEESNERGNIVFYIHQKELYDRIFEYFDLLKGPSSFVSSLDKPIEFELYTTASLTRWSSLEGTINCYHEWYGHDGWNEGGKIDFKINNLLLFEKFSSYALKFKP